MFPDYFIKILISIEYRTSFIAQKNISEKRSEMQYVSFTFED